MGKKGKKNKEKAPLQLPLEEKIYLLGYNSWNSPHLHGDLVGGLGFFLDFHSNQSKPYLPTVSFIQAFQLILGPFKDPHCYEAHVTDKVLEKWCMMNLSLAA